MVASLIRKASVQMTTPIVSSKAMLSSVTIAKRSAAGMRAYRTKTSFVAVHFDQAGKGRIVFLAEGSALRVIGPSSRLPEGFEVLFDSQLYNIFKTDLLERSIPICEPIRAKGRAVVACG
jgi:hypothetical protein